MRCGFSKSFLKDKFEVAPSQVWFREEGNRVEFDLSFGCGMFVYMGDYDNIKQGLEETEWRNWRSFFFSGKGWTKL